MLKLTTDNLSELHLMLRKNYCELTQKLARYEIKFKSKEQFLQ